MHCVRVVAISWSINLIQIHWATTIPFGLLTGSHLHATTDHHCRSQPTTTTTLTLGVGSIPFPVLPIPPSTTSRYYSVSFVIAPAPPIWTRDNKLYVDNDKRVLCPVWVDDDGGWAYAAGGHTTEHGRDKTDLRHGTHDRWLWLVCCDYHRWLAPSAQFGVWPTPRRPIPTTHTQTHQCRESWINSLFSIIIIMFYPFECALVVVDSIAMAY